MNKFNNNLKSIEDQYLDLLKILMYQGSQRSKERTGTGTSSIFGYSLRHNLNTGFPLLTTKRVFWRGVVEELAWMLRGSTDIKELQSKGVNIWNNDAERWGGTDLGPVYGAQWRSWKRYNTYKDKPLQKIDQIANLIKGLKENPESRRHILTAWDVGDLDNMALPPCHYAAQFYLSNKRAGKRHLSCMVHLRSSDVFLGLPFNIASYALLTHLIAHVVGAGVDELILTLGDAHLYLNHIDAAKKQIERIPKILPSLEVSKIDSNLKELKMDSINLIGYDPHGRIKAPLSV